jgi:hypothetical protein
MPVPTTMKKMERKLLQVNNIKIIYTASKLLVIHTESYELTPQEYGKTVPSSQACYRPYAPATNLGSCGWSQWKEQLIQIYSLF